MQQQKLLKLINYLLYLIICVFSVYTAPSTVRPYQFGFEIEEQQHRAEKRDERGIVMGEFGFITADGIYHVTVYATDEEGKFRILSMKNYPYHKREDTVAVTSTTTTTTAKPTTTTTKKPVSKLNPRGVQACSGCSLLSPKQGLDKEDSDEGGIDLRFGGADDFEPGLSADPKEDTKTTKKVTSFSKSTEANGESQKKLFSKTETTGDENSIEELAMRNLDAAAHSGGKTAVGGNENDAPSEDGGDLYRFKYILDYNGHMETGKRNGNKKGNYFVVADDNLEHAVDYIANEFGYQPHITKNQLNAPIAAKENKLKDYEFVWFNKPK